uniref:RRM domain-containing protein n=1 Tax=Alexandrium monilatum TaxID=311494 RepID=A0A7S4UYV9_9DINO
MTESPLLKPQVLPRPKLQPPQMKAYQAIRPGATTVVVRNVPRQIGQEEFLRYVQIEGFFDYFHLPYNLLQKRLLGYAFINFVSHDMAVTFQKRWHGRVFPGRPSRKALDIATAESQGWYDCLTRVKARKVHNLQKASYLPLINKDGHWLTAAQISELIDTPGK